MCVYGVLSYLASGQKEVGLCVVAHAGNPSFLKGEVEGGRGMGVSQPRELWLQSSHHRLWPPPAPVLTHTNPCNIYMA